MRRNCRVVAVRILRSYGPGSLLDQVVIISTIVGTVTDPQGAVVAGAKGTLRNMDAGIEWKATDATLKKIMLDKLL